MPNPKVSESEFIRLWHECGSSPTVMAKRLNSSLVAVNGRRRRIEARLAIHLPTVALTPSAQAAANHFGASYKAHAYEQLVYETVKDGSLIVFGDAHYWPGEKSVAHEAMCIVAKRLQPKLIIGNGDLFDGATVSRHDVLGWQKLPTVAEELDAVRSRLYEVKRAAPKAKTRATVGNHDSRMDRRLATEVPQFQDIHGFSLQDHLKDWPLSYAILINEATDPVFVVHNIRGGKYAPANNVLAAGCTVITGHLHSQKTIPLTQLLGKTLEGIDHGCLADPEGPQFSYRMSRPADWRSGFVVITFDKQGRMLPSEFCRVQWYKGYARAVFRGEVVFERRERVAA